MERDPNGDISYSRELELWSGLGLALCEKMERDLFLRDLRVLFSFLLAGLIAHFFSHHVAASIFSFIAVGGGGYIGLGYLFFKRCLTRRELSRYVENGLTDEDCIFLARFMPSLKKMVPPSLS